MKFHADGVGYGILAQFYSIAYGRCGTNASYSVEQLVALKQSGLGMGQIRTQVLGSASASECSLGKLKKQDLDDADAKEAAAKEHIEKDKTTTKPAVAQKEEKAKPAKPQAKPAKPQPKPAKPQAKPAKPQPKPHGNSGGGNGGGGNGGGGNGGGGNGGGGNGGGGNGGGGKGK